MSQLQLQRSSDEPAESRERSDWQAKPDAGPRPAGSAGQAGSAAGASGSCSRPAESAPPAEAPRGRLDKRLWWEKFPERLAYEYAALKSASIVFHRDDAAFNAGILRLHLEVVFGEGKLPLVVTFPDLYPYFRFQVDAPTLTLAHHQHPFFKNLCLLGRGTHHWRTTDTVAGLLQEQLQRVLITGREPTKEAVEGIEQKQAEPYSDYYLYPPSMVVLQKSGIFSATHVGGHFAIACAGPAGPPPAHFVRGAVSEVRGQNNELLFTADRRFLAPFCGPKIEGYWVRSAAPIPHGDHESFLKALLKNFPAAYAARINKVPGGWLQIWAVVFPEEHAWRDVGDDGIVFACLFHPNRKRMVQQARAAQPPQQGGLRRKKKPR